MKSYTILYVEDDTAIIELVEDVLAHPNVSLLASDCAPVATSLIRMERPDLLLLDVVMPDGSGWDIYQAVRRDDALRETPIIMVTGQLQRYRVLKAFGESPIDSYITKPFDAPTLRREVERMLGVRLWPV